MHKNKGNSLVVGGNKARVAMLGNLGKGGVKGRGGGASLAKGVKAKRLAKVISKWVEEEEEEEEGMDLQEKIQRVVGVG